MQHRQAEDGSGVGSRCAVLWAAASLQQAHPAGEVTGIRREKLGRETVLGMGRRRNISMLFGNVTCFVSLLGKSKL